MRLLCASLLAATAVGLAISANPALADWGDRYRAWTPHDGWDRPSEPPAFIATAQPAYRVTPHPCEASRPATCNPRPPHGTPDVSFGTTAH